MAAKSWKIEDGSRAHIVMGQLIKGRYHECWTRKTNEKLIAYGLAVLADANPSWGWGKSKTVEITGDGRAAYEAARGGVVWVAPPSLNQEP